MDSNGDRIGGPGTLYGPGDNHDPDRCTYSASIRKFAERKSADKRRWSSGSGRASCGFSMWKTPRGLVLAAQRYEGEAPVNLERVMRSRYATWRKRSAV